MVSRIGVEEDSVQKHEENALGGMFGTLSQMPDVNRELAEVRALQASFAAWMRAARERTEDDEV
ncbi:MAG: hypothetical protein AAF500_16455 [Myxococcota bacterium]